LLAREDGRDKALQGAEQRLGIPLAREEPLDLPVLRQQLGEERLLVGLERGLVLPQVLGLLLVCGEQLPVELLDARELGRGVATGRVSRVQSGVL
jgi:hypothetical protein